MKKISILLAFLLVFSLFAPVTNAYAYDAPNQKGFISPGHEVSGTLSKNSVGNSVPDEYTLNIERNSMVRIQAMTTVNDFTIDVDSPDNPNSAKDTYGVIKGDACTKVGSFTAPAAETYSTSGINVVSDKRNTNPYTEVFTNLSTGIYKIRVSGGPDYKFKIIVEPFMFQDDDSTMENSNIFSAMKINMEVPQDGNLISNGIKAGKYLIDDPTKISSDFYQFVVPQKGMYIAKITTDGFYQGTLEVLDGSKKFIHDGKVAVDLVLDGKIPTVIGTYEQHKSFAGKTFAVEFKAEISGIYYLQVTRKNFSSGSYQVVVNSTAAGASTLNPTGTPSVDVTNNAETSMGSLKINLQDTNIKLGNTVPLKLDAVYSNKDVQDVTVFAEWTSSDPKVATVDAAGQVKGIAAGTATIKANVDGKTAEVKVNVVTEAAQFKKLSPAKTKIYLKKGKTGVNKVTAYFSDGTKKDITGEVTLSTAGNSVAIYKNTILKGVKKGSSKITVTYGNMTTNYIVVVK